MKKLHFKGIPLAPAVVSLAVLALVPAAVIAQTAPTPTPSASPTQPVANMVSVTDPQNGQTVGARFTVRGTVTGAEPDGSPCTVGTVNVRDSRGAAALAEVTRQPAPAGQYALAVNLGNAINQGTGSVTVNPGQLTLTISGGEGNPCQGGGSVTVNYQPSPVGGVATGAGGLR